MSTLHSMNLALVDLEDRLVRELQFSADAEKQILDNLHAVREARRLEDEALATLERSIVGAFQERNRALSSAIGTGRPSPETVDADPQPARKRVMKAVAAAEGEAA